MCLFHDETERERGREARAAGARTSNKLRMIRGRRARLDTPAQLLRFVADLAHSVVAGDLSPDVVRAAVYALSLQRQLVEAVDLEKRVAELERGRKVRTWA